ncbi:MAG: cytochrome-c peroxidase [Flavobacteriales bacterium]|nr:cytochrome-c peroxidase [Flavobacteriales bacterium]
MNKVLYPAALSALLFITSCGSSLTPEQELELREHKRYDVILAEKSKNVFSSISGSASNPENEITPEKSKLGYYLYHDNRLSKNATQSCNTCHNLETFGVDRQPTSAGDLGGFGDRNSPTVLNAALHTVQFWDGRAADVEQQAGMPILNPVEMNIPNEAFLITRLKGIPLYQDLFSRAFPKETDPITYKNLRLAIAAFERTLITPSRFDKYLKGDSMALSLQEKKGMLTFIEVGCASCHYGPLLGGNSIQKFGVFHDFTPLTGSSKVDYGVFANSKNEADKFMFKVPSLRNISETYPYFHDGSVKALDQAVRIMGKTQLDYELSDNEVEKIVAFLGALTGELADPSVAKAPKELTSL